MNIIKINNLIKSNGEADYKGLDINKFIAGKQLYSSNFIKNNTCMVITLEEDIPTHKDVKIVTEEEYNLFKEEIKQNSPKTEEEILKERIASLELAMANIIGM